ncbi:MAG: 2-phospho-L-lactate guanylyltransferase [Chloroflexota bacterium]
MSGIWAIIPVKPLRTSKTRLAHVLSAEQRADLIRNCLLHTLAVLQQLPAIAGSWVISSDAVVLATAMAQGAQVLAEEKPCGLNAAVQWGLQTAVHAHADGILILPADLPFMTPGDVTMMIDAVRVHEGNGRAYMAICPDEQRTGTNALLLYPTTPFTFHYGPGSFQQHLAEARRRQRIPVVTTTPGLQFDLDTETDWQKYQQRTPSPNPKIPVIY